MFNNNIIYICCNHYLNNTTNNFELPTNILSLKRIFKRTNSVIDYNSLVPKARKKQFSVFAQNQKKKSSVAW